MGILWVRGNFDEKRQRHEEQRGLVFKKVQGGGGGERARRAGRWIYKTEELGEVGRANETDGWRRVKDLQMDGSGMHLRTYMSKPRALRPVRIDASVPSTNPPNGIFG